jgi:hypothetical protein
VSGISTGELLKVVISGGVGGSLALSGTILTLRHQRKLASDSWFRERQIDAAADVLAKVNYFSRAVGEHRFNYDERWVALADSIDKAGLVLVGTESLKALEVLSGKAQQVLRHQQHNQELDSRYWDLMDEVWKCSQNLSKSIRRDLGLDTLS